VYATANAFILGMFVGPLQVGYYGGAEKVSKALQNLTLPLTHALYPRMSHLVHVSARKAARLVLWTVSLVGASGLALGVALAALARVIVPLVLGPGYEPTIPVLYIFALLLPVNAVNNALILQWMLPLGMDKLVVKILLASIATNVGFAFFLAPRYAHVGMAWAILIAETVMFVTLTVALLRSSLTPLDVLRDVLPPSPELL
jgi:PST family polysaccharide transporter